MSDDYEPYGEAWEKEVKKMTKDELIAWLRRLLIHKNEMGKL